MSHHVTSSAVPDLQVSDKPRILQCPGSHFLQESVECCNTLMIQRSTHLAITALSYGGSQQLHYHEGKHDIVLICERQSDCTFDCGHFFPR